MKRNKIIRAIILMAFASLLLSCDGLKRGYINVDNIQGLVGDVCDTHDALLDGELDPAAVSVEDRESLKRSSAILRKVVEASKSPEGG